MYELYEQLLPTKLYTSKKTIKTRGPFLESPGNFTGPKTNIQIEI